MNIIFSPRQMKTWNRIGDLYCPACDGLPRFSATGCVEQIDAVLAAAPEQDIHDLKWLLVLLGLLPTAFLRLLIGWLDQSERFPNSIAKWMRLVRLALKGPVVSVYYGNLHRMGYQGVTVHQRLGYDAHCEPDAPASMVRHYETELHS